MALGYSERELRKTGRPEDAALADVVEGVLKARDGKDISLPNPSLLSSKEQNNSLELATKEYKRHPVDPENATAFWQAFYSENPGKVDLTISVPECAFTQEQLEEMRRKHEGPIYLPVEFSTQESRHLLGKMFPKMQSHSVKNGNSVTNEVSRSGWRRFDMLVDAPYLNTNERELREALVRDNKEEPTLNEYIIASQASKLLTNRYLDEGATWSRILGSRDDGDVVDVSFDSDGALLVHSGWHPDDRSSGMGGRSSRGVNLS